MSTWFSLYVHDAEPEVCSRDGRVWVTFMVQGPTGAPNTVVLMLKNRAVAHTIGEALLVAAREPDIEAEPSDEFPRETLASA